MERMPFFVCLGAAAFKACQLSGGGVLVSLVLAFLFYFLIPAPESKK